MLKKQAKKYKASLKAREQELEKGDEPRRNESRKRPQAPPRPTRPLRGMAAEASLDCPPAKMFSKFVGAMFALGLLFPKSWNTATAGVPPVLLLAEPITLSIASFIIRSAILLLVGWPPESASGGTALGRLPGRGVSPRIMMP